jgi:hypothetical protein
MVKSLKKALSGPDRWLFTVRVLVLIFMLFLAGIFIAGVIEYPLYAASHPEKFTTWGWTPQEMNWVWGRMGLSFQWWVQFSLVIDIVFAILVCSIGIFLFIRKGGDWFGLYLSACFVLFGTLSGYMAGVVGAIHPGLEPILTPLGVFAWVSLILVLFIFPNGHFVPGWTRWVGVLLLVSFGVDIIFNHGGTPPPFLLLPMMSLIAAGPASQVYRYRKVSNALERQQTKLVMLAMMLVVTVLLFGLIPLFAPDTIDPTSPVAVLMAILSSAFQLIMGLIPLSIALAVLRYRLWDIDLVIRRTLAYGVITAVLALIYLGGVTLFQQILTSLTGQKSPAAVVLSTLLVAALFTPLRRRLQMIIDTRFFRQKVYTARALEEFSSAARREVEMEVLSNRLAAAVQESLEPESISLWMKNQEEKR